MSTAENKELLQRIFDGLDQGNSRPLVDAMDDDFTWTVSGTTKWSRGYEGKRAVLDQFFAALRARFIFERQDRGVSRHHARCP